MKKNVSRAKLREHRIVTKDGQVLYAKTAYTFSEVLQEYIDAGKPLTNLNFTSRDLTGIVFPANSDLSECDFSNCVMDDVIAKQDCKFEYCLFSNTKSSGSTFLRSSFLGSEFINMTFKYGHIKYAKFEDIKMTASSFLRMRGYKASFNGAKIEDTSFLQSGFALSSWRRSTVVHSTFKHIEFVPIKMAAEEAEKRAKNGAQIGKDKNFLLFINSLFEDANFVGCTYENARMPNVVNFPNDFKQQAKSNAFVRSVFGVGAYVVFEHIADFVKDDIHDFAASSHMLHGLIKYAPNVQTELDAVMMISAIAATFWLDKIRDKFNECTKNSGATSLQSLKIARLNMRQRLKGLSDLVILSGSKLSMSHIKAALIASSMSWKWQGRSMIYKRNFVSLVSGNDQIIICNKNHLKDAMDVLARLENKSNKHIPKITFVAPEIKNQAISAIAISDNRHARAVYKTKTIDPDFNGFIVLLWDQYGRIRNTTSVPKIADEDMKKIINGDKQLKNFIVNGQASVLKAMVSSISPDTIEKYEATLREVRPQEVTDFIQQGDTQIECNESLAISDNGGSSLPIDGQTITHEHPSM